MGFNCLIKQLFLFIKPKTRRCLQLRRCVAVNAGVRWLAASDSHNQRSESASWKNVWLRRERERV